LLKTIALPDGHALHPQFDASRRLARVTDSYGNWLTAAYWDNAAELLTAFAPATKTSEHGSGYRGRLKSLTLSTGEQTQYGYDPHGNLSAVTYSDGTVKRYEYDDSSGKYLLSKIIGRDGRLAASYEYDATGHATRSSHPDHRDDVNVSYQWPAPGQSIGQTIVEATAGAKTTYTWRADPQAQLPVIVKADGPGCRTCAAGNVRYEYDGHERVNKTVRVDEQGLPVEQVTTSVDDLGRTRAVEILHFVDGQAQSPGWTETREYSGDSLLPTLITRPSVVPGHEHTLKVEYNERGQPTRITENGFQFEEHSGSLPVSLALPKAAALERVTVLSYTKVHGLSLLTSVDGPLPGPSDTSIYQYDAVGRLQVIAHPGHVVERFERDTLGRVVAHTGLDGVRETLQYGTDGHITRFARGDTWMTLGYDQAGRIEGIHDSLGQQLTLIRDASGQLTQLADPAGNRIEWSYTDHGEVRSVSLLNPDGTVDQRRRAELTSTGPADAGSSIENEAMLSAVARALPDEVAKAIPGLQPAQGPGTTSGSPEDPNVRVAYAMPIGIQTAYDIHRRATTYVYDDFGRMTAEHSPVSGTTRFRWDEADHLIERVAADESVTRITRDPLGRAIRIRAGPEDGRIDWGIANRPTRITYRAGEERFEYDAQARLTAHVLAVDGKQFRITYEFDSLGRMERKHLPDGTVLHYRYNGSLHPKPGVLAGIYKEGLVERPIITDLNTADERFSDRGFTFGNGLSQHRVLDVDGRLLSDGNPKVGQSHLDWSHPARSPATYTRIANVGAEASADLLPSLGSRIAARVTEFGDSEALHVSRTAAAAYTVNDATFDTRGQLIEDSQHRYEWDALGRLARVFKRDESGFTRTTFSAGSHLPQSVIAEYRYNLLGERIAKLVQDTDGPKLTYFLWDGDEISTEIDQRGKVLRNYVYLDGRPVALLAGRAIYSIHTDHRMAPVAVTDSNRRVVWQADVQDNGAAAVTDGSEIDLPLRASNQYFDAETGLHYNVYRYLDAGSGRYLSPDPMGLAAGPDVYQFALGQPHVFVDVLGLQPTQKDWSKASYSDKALEIIKRAIPLVPNEIGAALNQLIQPQNLVVMAAVFAGFAAMQATPIGWIADVAILGYSAWQLGSGLTLVIDTLLQFNTDVKNAKCDPDLDAAAKRLSSGFVTSTGDVVGGLAGVWGVKSSGGITRIANGITTLFDYAKGAFGVSEKVLVLEGSTGLAPANPPLKTGIGGTVPQAQTKIAWTTDPKLASGQGLPFENWLEPQLAAKSRLPTDFKTFDFFDFATGRATSAKTLNTMGPSYIKTPSLVYSNLKTYIDATTKFTSYTKDGVTVTSAIIKARDVQLAIPASTNAAQWAQIVRAVDYAKSVGVNLIVTVVK